MQLLHTIRAKFEPILSQWLPEPAALQASLERIVASRDASLADYQANVAMPLQKIVGKPPLEIAEAIVKGLHVEDLCSDVGIAGGGYVNLRLSHAFLESALETAYQSEKIGVEGVREPKTVVVDYSSPNVAKPMHVGHIRSTVIGDSIAKILRFLGHHVITDNHLGDWGTQFGMIIYGYKHFRDEEAFQKAPVAELGRLYRVVQRIIGYQSLVTNLPTLERNTVLAAEKLQSVTEKQAAAPNDKKLQKELKSASNAAKESVAELESAKQAIASTVGHALSRAMQCTPPTGVASPQRNVETTSWGPGESRTLGSVSASLQRRNSRDL